ncbi:MAG: YihY/virulence factor BrkB family protein [Muribaculaceae bacterium]|nr:YihY/virulence factor BrkB family protein [Muribaculaceae bacterium]
MENNSTAPSRIARTVEWCKKIWNYASDGVWTDDSNRWYVRVVKTLSLSVRSFLNTDLQGQACAMTYRTLLAIVPALALLFAIGRGFNMQGFLEDELMHLFPAQKTAVKAALGFVDSYLNQSTEGVFVGVGIVFLLWTLISLLMSVEDSFNLVWGVREGRSVWRKLTDYTAMLIVLPVLLICSGGITLLVSSTLQSLMHWDFMTPLVSAIMEGVSWLLTWLFFTVAYVAIPNTRVKFLNAMPAGALATVGFLGLQWVFVTGQMYVSRYNAIYGSFSFLPLLLIWLQLVWLITLAGAVLCYSSQNIFRFNFANESSKISLAYRRRVVLAIATVIVRRFDRGESAPAADDFVNGYGLPSRLVGDAIDRLTACGLVNRVIIDEKRELIGFQPAMTTDAITVAMVNSRLDNLGSGDFVPDFRTRFPGVVRVCDAVTAAMQHAGDSTLLRDLEIE